MDLYDREKIRRLLKKLSDQQDNTPVYDIDEETRELIEAALNMVAQTATLQLNEESATGLLDICDAIAERFGIESHEITVKDETPNYDDGDSSITVYKAEHRTARGKPKLKVIHNDKLSSDTPDDDDQIH
jgi:type III secretory pathway component EscV